MEEETSSEEHVSEDEEVSERGNGVENRPIFTGKDGGILRSLFEDMMVGKSSIVKAHIMSKLKNITQ